MDRTRLNRFINQTLLELPLEEATTVEPSQSVRAALALMREGSRSCVLAMSGNELAGIFTERDVLTKCMGEGFDWEQPLEASVLTRSPRTIVVGATVAEALATMQQHHYRTLPVVDGERVVGLIRMGDLLTHLAEAYPEDILNLPPRPHQVMERPEGG
ncbi:MAG: CBS domain-containing protein [Tepidiformaceae bacterium]